MKNQYFGDIRDLFKFDLVFQLIAESQLVDRFTFVPMLTRPDNRPDGRKLDHSSARAGYRNQELVGYLQECIQSNRRDIREIDSFFRQRRVETAIYDNQGNGYFEHRTRAEYFKGIRADLLRNAVILLDPDNGLEIARSRERHLLFSEVKSLYDRMGDASILVIYQHFPREDRQRYIERRMSQLNTWTGARPAYISDNQIVFFLLTRNCLLDAQVAHTMSEYAKRYKEISIGKS